jgi:hypothetical protein
MLTRSGLVNAAAAGWRWWGAGTTYWQCQARARNREQGRRPAAVSDRVRRRSCAGAGRRVCGRGEAVRWICADLLAGQRPCDRLGDSRTEHRYGGYSLATTETEYARHRAIPDPACRQTGRHRRRTRPAVRPGTDCATRLLSSWPTPGVSVYTVMILLGQESRARPTHALTCRVRSCRCSVTRSRRRYTEGVEPEAITAHTGIRIRWRTRRRNRDVLLVWRSTCTGRCGTRYLEIAHHIYCGVGQRLIVEMPRVVPALKPQLQVVHADRKQRQ